MTPSDGTEQPTGDLTDRASRFDRSDFRSRDLPTAAPAPAVPPASTLGAATAAPPTSRASRFDRADFGLARAAEGTLPPESRPGSLPAGPDGDAAPSEPGSDAELPANPATERTEPPYRGDALAAADHLRDLGWSRDKIAMILRGPDSHSIHEIACPEVKGSPLPEVQGKPTGEYGKETPDRPTRDQANPLGVNQLQIVTAIWQKQTGDSKPLKALSDKLEKLPGELQAYLAAALGAIPTANEPSAPILPFLEGKDALLGLGVSGEGDELSRYLELKRGIVGDEVALLLPAMPRDTSYPFVPTLAGFAEAARKLQLYRGMEQSLFPTSEAAAAPNG